METFQCPKCGAPVSYDRDVVGMNLTARCPYCNSSLSAPGAVRARPTQVNIRLDSSTSVGKTTNWIWLIVIVPLLGVGVIMAAVAILIPLMRRTDATNGRRPLLPTTTKPTGNKDQPPGFARLILNFGGEGIGPGMFKDARSIAVDASGRIYVGEYTGGRIQVFGPDGKFLTQWTVDPKMPLRGLAADRKGTVYVVQAGKITRHEGETGKLLGELDYAGGGGFDDLRMSADGGFVAAWYSNRDDVVRFNSAGEVTRILRAAISSTSGDSELNTRVAIDGYLKVFKPDGMAFGMVFNDNNELIMAVRNHVLKYSISD